MELNKQPATILIVDDEDLIRMTLSVTIASFGFHCIVASDGLEAIEILKRTKCDLVLSDIIMPNMDGLTLIKSLRGLPTYSKIPIVVLTTEASDAMKTQGRAAGATGWMVKPFEPAKLLEVAKKVMG